MKTNKNETELPFTSEKFSQIWLEWIQYRKEEGFPAYKPTGLRRTLSGLERDSGGSEETAINIIINAMEKTWRGLFPIKNGAINQRSFTGNKTEARIIPAGNRGEL